ncbi:hypothetical protein [Paenibacillus xylaniclasticus]|uniref:hypothetical protein n=1 Tax=Paenibacillus xylaniclasticus TaxID=588083 RepID=UPI000FDA0BE0|nr:MULTISPECIES: hypothetical protein [Paenibacillus]GFN32799.1 hypothetical protein PCURB6_30590 [Paenibacillus curdlanolyticus]
MIKKGLLYGASLVLFCWYVGILYFAVHPNVSEAYRLYYISHELKHWKGNQGIIVLSNEKIPFDSIQDNRVAYLGKGWSSPEDWGIWMEGREANLYMQLSSRPDGPIEMQLQSLSFLPEGSKEFSIEANGHPIGSIKAKYDGSTLYTVTIPSNLLSNNLLLHIKIINPVPISPAQIGQSSDIRELGLGVQWMKLTY